MVSTWLRKTLTLALLVLGECHVFEGPWCYNEHQCGPSTWVSLGECGGKRQSPIDINTNKTVVNSELGPITLTGYGDPKKLLEMENTGKTVDVILGDGLHFSAQGLPATYTARTFHFHWGDGVYKPGSEHRINGKQYSMEFHIVHTKNNMSIPDALKDSEGIAVLAFFIQSSEGIKGKTAEAWESLIKHLPRVSEKDKRLELESEVSLQELVSSVNLDQYYRYHGSLTTPFCNEVVTWTIFAEPILVSLKVVDAFPELYSTRGINLVNNFRPLQKIDELTVEASAAMKPVISSAPSLDSQPIQFLLLVFFTAIISFLPI